jgi:hypothetical protein
MSALYMLRNPTGYFALLFLAIARPVTVDVLVVRILYLACMKDSKMQAGTDFPNIGLMSNTLRSIQVAGIIRCGAVRPTALPERDQSAAG